MKVSPPPVIKLGKSILANVLAIMFVNMSSCSLGLAALPVCGSGLVAFWFSIFAFLKKGMWCSRGRFGSRGLLHSVPAYRVIFRLSPLDIPWPPFRLYSKCSKKARVQTYQNHHFLQVKRVFLKFKGSNPTLNVFENLCVRITLYTFYLKTINIPSFSLGRPILFWLHPASNQSLCTVRVLYIPNKASQSGPNKSSSSMPSRHPSSSSSSPKPSHPTSTHHAWRQACRGASQAV